MVDADFPEGTYYAVTWGIEVKHGGMTNAMLHRSRMLVRASGRPITIVTYKYDPQLRQIESTLREQGKLLDQMSIVNLWEDLCSWDDDKLATFREVAKDTSGTYFDPLPVPEGTAPPAYAEKLREDGTFLQRDYRRADGTLAVSHRQFFLTETTGVDVTLCDRNGDPIGSLPAIRQLYRFWLDTLPRDPMAFFIIDSKTSANHYPEYRRDDARTIYMVHGSHLADGVTSPFGQLSPGRRHTFEHLADYDGVVFLTDAQRDDVMTAYGDLGNFYVCPNSRETGDEPTAADLDRRPVRRGVAMGALVPGKRFSHVIRAVRAARRELCFVKVDIFGEGVQEPKLQASIRRWRVKRRVRLAGFTSDPLAEFARASFMLMTSNREGFGLVLVEAMSQGCVPIAYDIKYGPSDIITDGVDGFLVEPGDIDGLGAAIKRLVTMPARERRAMREAAVRRSADFDDDVVVERWRQILTSVAQRQVTSTR